MSERLFNFLYWSDVGDAGMGIVSIKLNSGARVLYPYDRMLLFIFPANASIHIS